MKITVFGMNHKSAPVEMRERVSFSDSNTIAKLVEFFINNKNKRYHAVPMSTCNRVEIYLSLPAEDDETKVFSDFFQLIHKRAYIERFEKFIYKYSGLDAALHLYKVVSGLDSMVLGETQIAGQVRDAYYFAKTSGITDSLLNKLFESALRTGKLVRTKTLFKNISDSVSSVAVEKAKEIFSSIKNMKVLVVGAGETSELTCESLHKHGATSIIVSSRNYDNAVKLAKKFGGEAVVFEKLYDSIMNSDIVISQTASPRPIIKHKMMQEIMEKRNYRKLFLIDIAVPRDVEDACGAINNLYLYNIDSLQAIADKNMGRLSGEIKKSEEIIGAGIFDFSQYLKQREIRAILKLVDKLKSDIKNDELNRLKQLDNPNGSMKNIEIAYNRIVNKALHPFIKALQTADRSYEKMLIALEKNLKEFEIPGE